MNQWNDKRYYSYDYFLKEMFHEKVYKLSLDAGMTCPNRDGTLSYGGCIFCSKGGSGDFAASRTLSITEQITEAKKRVANKAKSKHFIAYFQAYTNTYAPLPYLKSVFMEAISHPDIVAISIATRPDCLPEEVLDLLTQLNQIKPVFIELGLQTMHDSTAKLIRRGYSLDVFTHAVNQLHKRGLPSIVHIILGLPTETIPQMLETISFLNQQPIHGVKLQLLHVLKETDLAYYYIQHPEQFHVMDFETYVDLLIHCLEALRSDIVIHRLTGDGPKDMVIAPLWSLNKRMVLNTVNQQLSLRHTWQGRKELSICNLKH